jgi:hypothetical protein
LRELHALQGLFFLGARIERNFIRERGSDSSGENYRQISCPKVQAERTVTDKVFRLWQSGEWTVAEFSAFFHVAKIGWVTTAELKLASVGAPTKPIARAMAVSFRRIPER